MANFNEVSTPASSVIAIRLGKDAIMNLRRMADRESVKHLTKITVSDLIKKALLNSYPTEISEADYD